jgi:hypothetical protein
MRPWESVPAVAGPGWAAGAGFGFVRIAHTAGGSFVRIGVQNLPRLGFIRIAHTARGSFVRIGLQSLRHLGVRLNFRSGPARFGRGEARVCSDAVRQASGSPGPIGPRGAHDTAPALTMAPCSPPDVHGKGGHAAAEGLQCNRL